MLRKKIVVALIVTLSLTIATAAVASAHHGTGCAPDAPQFPDTQCPAEGSGDGEGDATCSESRGGREAPCLPARVVEAEVALSETQMLRKRRIQTVVVVVQAAVAE